MKPPPTLGVIGWSGAGKTTLLVHLLRELSARGLRVLAIKHSSHLHPLHKPGSDTELMEGAGAAATGMATPAGLQLTLPGDAASLLPLLVEALGARFDLVLIEGWKEGPFQKIEVWREGLGPCLALERGDVIALVTDGTPPSPLPRFGLGDVDELARFLLERLRAP
jgi:molybdopterin-guanine dinucleotide biosynthesis protein MobB